MKAKRYSSPSVRFTINVKKNGKQTPLVFDQYSSDYKRRFIVVTDPEIMEQLEKNPDFKVYFHLDQEFDIPDPEEVINANDEESLEEVENTDVNEPEENIAPDEDVEEVEEHQKELTDDKVKHFSKSLDAKKFLNDLGVAYNKITTKADMISEGAKLGYTIVFES